jgi:hypothetical protein
MGMVGMCSHAVLAGAVVNKVGRSNAVMGTYREPFLHLIDASRRAVGHRLRCISQG